MIIIGCSNQLPMARHTSMVKRLGFNSIWLHIQMEMDGPVGRHFVETSEIIILN